MLSDGGMSLDDTELFPALRTPRMLENGGLDSAMIHRDSIAGDFAELQVPMLMGSGGYIVADERSSMNSSMSLGGSRSGSGVGGDAHENDVVDECLTLGPIAGRKMGRRRGSLQTYGRASSWSLDMEIGSPYLYASVSADSGSASSHATPGALGLYESGSLGNGDSRLAGSINAAELDGLQGIGQMHDGPEVPEQSVLQRLRHLEDENEQLRSQLHSMQLVLTQQHVSLDAAERRTV
eukprot:ANDGO_08039.mRNA.1 hypothetical protein